ncbi:hypothetical protein [Nostoc sp.]|uniref:hypothetical protein n=1 Tax=Nostoc sp. TaxID=1180 RepID=UPI002FF3D89F
MLYFLLGENRDCIAVDAKEWLAWYKNTESENCDVAEDFLLDREVRISTMFTGLSWEVSPKEPPKPFLTIVFVGYGIDEQYRYSTWDQALIGHKKTVAKLKSDFGLQ